MSGSQYQLQIEKLKELMAYLRQFDAEIQNAVNSYRAKLSALIEQGLPAEVGEKFTSDLYPQSKSLSDRNSAVINDQAISFLARNIQGLEQLLGR
jgi:hypothetical protein